MRAISDMAQMDLECDEAGQGSLALFSRLAVSEHGLLDGGLRCSIAASDHADEGRQQADASAAHRPLIGIKQAQREPGG